MTSAVEFLGTEAGQATIGAAGQLGAAALGARASGRAAGQLRAGAEQAAGISALQAGVAREDIGQFLPAAQQEVRGSTLAAFTDILGSEQAARAALE